MFELPTSLSLSAFCNESLGDLVHELREELEREGVPDNKSYASEDIVLGNVTISRFTTEPNADFKRKVEELKNIEIGSFEVSIVSLITTNCVCLPDMTKIIDQYELVLSQK